MKGYIYTTSVDPGNGVFLNDPILDGTPTLGACVPNIRRAVEKGDYVFTISGKTAGIDQYVIGGFEVERKLHALAALDEFPQNTLHLATDGSKRGNIIVNTDGAKNAADKHNPKTFKERLENYTVGKNPIHINTQPQIKIARAETLDILKSIFSKDGDAVFDIIARWRKMDENQVRKMLEWLESIKKAS